MTFFSEQQCLEQCLSKCYSYYQYYRCQGGLTKISLVYDIIYIMLFILIGVSLWRVYDIQKRRMGFTRVRKGCCFAYLPPQERPGVEMQQRLFVQGQNGELVELPQGYEAIQQHVQQPPQQQDQPHHSAIKSSEDDIKPVLPNTAPQF
ncbi:hypothetical protein SS50377_24751 [Spironucleus salmonicida]|uniref:Transmembrane protein n=1 Tax=Spironucleus salmonicida TaxID=348837 RepID=V6LLI9_9EUKA|nr:hypothetical protein SS50377_24751 [Spironucleus salmonicida]|eukprot:EST44631.1 Hypothetical protein SS50377_15638 [Spironucleus salmonicida]